MKVLITGGFGFLGRQLCQRILALGELVGCDEQKHAVTAVVLTDLAQAPPDLPSDPRVKTVSGDVSDPTICSSLVDEDGMIVFHLASVMSGQGEKDFDLCLRVNLGGTRNLLEACRARKGSKLIFASTGACFGERPAGPQTDTTKLLPHTTYGMTKACCELLVNDYSRRGFLDGRCARLPTVIPRPEVNSGLPAAFSAVIREPLKGQDVVLPLRPDQPHAVCGFRPLVRNLLHLAELPQVALAGSLDRTLNMPALRVTLRELEAAMAAVVRRPENLGRVTYEVDPELSAKLATFQDDMEVTRARSLGFFGDSSPADIVVDFAAEYLDVGLLKPVLEIQEEPKHNLMLSNRFIRVYRTEFPVGQATLWHAHRVDSLYFFYTGTRVRVEKQGQEESEDTLEPGEVRYGDHCNCALIHRIHCKGPKPMFCLDIELTGYAESLAAAAAFEKAGDPPAKRTRSEAPLLPGLKLTKERPGARVWSLVLAPGNTWQGSLPFERLLWVVHEGGKVSGSLGERLLLPADVGFLDGPGPLELSLQVEKHGSGVQDGRELRLWLVELL